MPLLNTPPSLLSTSSCMKARRFLLTLTTFTLSRPLSESVSCRTFANEHSASMRASSSIAARPASGMPAVKNLPTSRTCTAKAKSPSGPETGLSPAIAKASSSSAHRSVRLPGGRRSNVSSPASLTCQIFKPPGCYCTSAPRRGPTTSCAMCPPHSQPSSLRITMPLLRHARALLCTAVITCQPLQHKLRSSPSASADWGCALQLLMPRLPTGLPGSTPCQQSRHAPRRSLLTSAVRSQPLMPVAPQQSRLQHRPQPTSQRRVATSPLGDAFRHLAPCISGAAAVPSWPARSLLLHGLPHA